MIRLGIFGATGRLGKMIGISALAHPLFTLSAAIGRSSAGKDYGSFLQLPPIGVAIQKVPSEPLPDLFIDVSLATGLEERLACQKPLVIGTTGFSPAEFLLIEKAARELPIFYASNFSFGMAILKRLAHELATYFPEDAHVDLTETHHSEKKDAPSGSALMLSKTIQRTRPEINVPIHSIRSGQIVGEHTIQFNNSEERLTLSHQVHSRAAFAKGALAAAEFLIDKPPGLYGMDELLAEKPLCPS